jgi:type I restriction enzyme, S subunit
MKDSGIEWLGDANEQWPIRPFNFFAQLKYGYAFNSEDFSFDEGVPVVRIGDLQNGQVSLDSAVRVTQELAVSKSDFFIKKADLLIALTGATIGKSCLFTSDTPALLNQRVGALRVNETADIGFLKYVIDSEIFRRFIEYESLGGAQENIGKEQFSRLKVPIPLKVSEQQEIARYLDSAIGTIDSQCSKIKKSISLLSEYRQSLITSVVTGKIDVREEVAV